MCCLLVVLVMLSVPVQVIGLEILVSKMTCNVLLCGDVKAYSLVHYITEQRCVHWCIA